jgi:hypothetical protein
MLLASMPNFILSYSHTDLHFLSPDMAVFNTADLTISYTLILLFGYYVLEHPLHFSFQLISNHFIFKLFHHKVLCEEKAIAMEVILG